MILPCLHGENLILTFRQNYYGLGFANHIPTQVQAARAATLVHHCTHFKLQLESERLPPMTVRGYMYPLSRPSLQHTCICLLLGFHVFSASHAVACILASSISISSFLLRKTPFGRALLHDIPFRRALLHDVPFRRAIAHTVSFGLLLSYCAVNLKICEDRCWIHAHPGVSLQDCANLHASVRAYLFNDARPWA